MTFYERFLHQYVHTYKILFDCSLEPSRKHGLVIVGTIWKTRLERGKVIFRLSRHPPEQIGIAQKL